MLVILGFRAKYLLGKINCYNMEKERYIYAYAEFIIR